MNLDLFTACNLKISDFLNKLIDVSNDCNLKNPDELVKFLFLVHNQNTHVCENLLKDMKPECTL